MVLRLLKRLGAVNWNLEEVIELKYLLLDCKILLGLQKSICEDINPVYEKGNPTSFLLEEISDQERLLQSLDFENHSTSFTSQRCSKSIVEEEKMNFDVAKFVCAERGNKPITTPKEALREIIRGSNVASWSTSRINLILLLYPYFANRSIILQVWSIILQLARSSCELYSKH